MAFATIADDCTPSEVAEGLRRYDGLVDEVILSPPSFRGPPERVA